MKCVVLKLLALVSIACLSKRIRSGADTALAGEAGAHRQHVRGRRHRRRARPHGGRPARRDLQAAVLRRDPRRRDRAHRPALGHGHGARWLQPRAHDAVAAGHHPDHESGRRLRPGARPHQHRLCRRLADRVPGQPVERHQDLRGFHGPRARERSAAHLFVVRPRWQRPPDDGVLRPARRRQGRARALQGRVAGPGGPDRRPHRVQRADRRRRRRAICAAARSCALANTADARLPDYPDLPTLKELGYPELVATTWFSISAPARLAPDIAEKINRAIVAGLAAPRDAAAAAPRWPHQPADEHERVRQIHRLRELRAGSR